MLPLSRRIALALLLCAPLLTAQAAAIRSASFSIEPPVDWAVQQGFMGAALTARPEQARDAEGWANDLLLVTAEPFDPRRTCLDGFVLRKLKDMGHLANHFEVINETALTLGSAQATRLELRYGEGPRELSAYMVVMVSGQQMVTATLATEPGRFEFRRATFRSAIDSLRPLRGRPAKKIVSKSVK